MEYRSCAILLSLGEGAQAQGGHAGVQQCIACLGHVGRRGGRIEFDQHLPCFHRLPVTHQNPPHHAGFRRLHHLRP
ncbi:hypothetical protein D3C73_1274530 [compost metagenome]